MIYAHSHGSRFADQLLRRVITASVLFGRTRQDTDCDVNVM